MITIELEKITENLIKIQNVKAIEVQNQIVNAFGNYEFQGESQVMICSYDEIDGFKPTTGLHHAYINHMDSPIIEIELEEVEKGFFTVVKAWIDILSLPD